MPFPAFINQCNSHPHPWLAWTKGLFDFSLFYGLSYVSCTKRHFLTAKCLFVSSEAGNFCFFLAFCLAFSGWGLSLLYLIHASVNIFFSEICAEKRSSGKSWSLFLRLTRIPFSQLPKSPDGNQTSQWHEVGEWINNTDKWFGHSCAFSCKLHFFSPEAHFFYTQTGR